MSDQQLPLEVQLVRIMSHYAANILEEQGLDFDWSHTHFDNVIAQVRAEAERRGAERAWDEAIEYAWDDSAIYEADAKRAKAANPYRADQMEGDDE